MLARSHGHSCLAISMITFQFQCLSSMSTALSKMTSSTRVHVCIRKCMTLPETVGLQLRDFFQILVVDFGAKCTLVDNYDSFQP